MPFELVYSSVPKGLMPGSRGFCVIAATRGIPSDLARRLESLSGYRHLFSPSDPRNPVLYHFVRMHVGHEEYYVLSKIRDAGFDYSGRSNKLAHHVALRRDELVEVGPAEVLFHWDTCFPWAEGTVGYLEHRRIAFDGVTTSNSEVPGSVVNDPEWLQYFAATTAALPPQQSLWFIYPAGWQPLGVIRQIWSRLPAESRWEQTFSTWSPLVPGHISCNLRFVCDGTSEAGDVRRNSQIRFWDLTAPLGPAPEPVKSGVGSSILSEPACDLPGGFNVDLKPSRATGFPLEEPIAQRLFRAGPSLPPTSYQNAVRYGHVNVAPPIVPADSPAAIPVGTGDAPSPGVVMPAADGTTTPTTGAPMPTFAGSGWLYTSVLVAPTLAVLLGVLGWVVVASRLDSKATVATANGSPSQSTKENTAPKGSGQQKPESQHVDKSKQRAQSVGIQKLPENQEETPRVLPDARSGEQSAKKSEGFGSSTPSEENEPSNTERSEDNGLGGKQSAGDVQLQPHDPQRPKNTNDSEANAHEAEESSSKTAFGSQDSKDSATKSPPIDSSAPRDLSPAKAPKSGDSLATETGFEWFGDIPDRRQTIHTRIAIPLEEQSDAKSVTLDKLFEDLKQPQKPLGKKVIFVFDLSRPSMSESRFRELVGDSVEESHLERVRKGNAILCVCNYFGKDEQKLVWFGLIVPKDYVRTDDEQLLNQTSQPDNFIGLTAHPVSLPNYEKLFEQLVNRFTVKVKTRLLALGPSKLSKLNGNGDGDSLTLGYNGQKCSISVRKEETHIVIDLGAPNKGEEQQSTSNPAGDASISDEEFHQLLRQCRFYLCVEFEWKEHKSAKDNNPTDKATWFAVPFKLGGN